MLNWPLLIWVDLQTIAEKSSKLCGQDFHIQSPVILQPAGFNPSIVLFVSTQGFLLSSSRRNVQEGISSQSLKKTFASSCSEDIKTQKKKRTIKRDSHNFWRCFSSPCLLLSPHFAPEAQTNKIIKYLGTHMKQRGRGGGNLWRKCAKRIPFMGFSRSLALTSS